MLASSLLALPFVLLAQAVGDDCTATPDVQVCGGADILFCNPNTNLIEAFSCADQASGSVCATDTCDGVCENFITCQQSRNGTCIGAAPLLDSDTNNDALFMAVTCEAGDACTLDFSAQTETCRASPIGACSQSGAQCVGSDLVICVGFQDSNDFTVAPIVLRCGTDGATCGEGADGPACLADTDPECGGDPQANRCLDGSRIVCDEGVVVDEEDCIARGQACVTFDGSPSCVTADPECGPLGVGVCTGNVATICEGGSVSSELDCSTVGRRCGAIDENGSIGCAVNGGEGEGEGEPECEDDSDCDDDEECDDGQCERAGGGRDRGGDDVIEPAPLFACASATPGAVGLSVVALALLRRRRR
jgi:hypothetical protein